MWAVCSSFPADTDRLSSRYLTILQGGIPGQHHMLYHMIPGNDGEFLYFS